MRFLPWWVVNKGIAKIDPIQNFEMNAWFLVWWRSGVKSDLKSEKCGFKHIQNGRNLKVVQSAEKWKGEQSKREKTHHDGLKQLESDDRKQFIAGHWVSKRDQNRSLNIKPTSPNGFDSSCAILQQTCHYSFACLWPQQWNWALIDVPKQSLC